MHIRPIPARFPEVAPGACKAIDAVVRAILAEEPRLGDVSVFGPDVKCGIGAGPAVLFGDTREIALLSEGFYTRYDYRIGWLADSGDAVVIGTRPCRAFEEYQRKVLDQPGIRYLHINAPDQRIDRPSPVLCLRDGYCFDAIAELARTSGQITLVAHIVTGTIWALAARLQREAGVPVFVAGPPPRLTRAVNDKLWFGAMARGVLGDTATPEKRAAHSLSALTRHVSDLLPKWQQLVVKVPDSAGGAGQFMIPTGPLRRLSARELNAFLRTRIFTSVSRRQFPLAVEVWDANVVASPSVQVWIPIAQEGVPIIEGIYEQLLADDDLTFSGASTATLPSAIDATLALEAMKLSLALQALGYFGRCSFDAVVTGRLDAAAAIHWIECNGRWGGVSIPMSLLSRLGRGGPLPAHVILQDHLTRLPPMPFSEAVTRVPVASDGESESGRILLLSPEPYELGRGTHLLATGRSREDAFTLAGKCVDLLGN